MIIVLFLLGGVAQLQREPDSPGREAWMAVAGPLVSVAIGGVSLAAAFAPWAIAAALRISTE